MSGKPLDEEKKATIRKLWPELSCATIGKRVTMSTSGVYNAGIKMGLPPKGRGQGQGLTDFDMEG